MECNHMLDPAATAAAVATAGHGDNETNRQLPALGPPPARPPQSLMGASSPPAYSIGDLHVAVNTVRLPDVPTTELPPIQRHHHDVQLPSLSSITGDHSPPREVAVKPQYGHWGNFNDLSRYHTNGSSHSPHNAIDSPARMDLDNSSTSVTSAASPDRFLDGRASSVSLDDPDVRLAAEALGDLRADFVSSPPNRNSTLPVSPPTSHGFQQASRTQTQSPQQQPPQPEPLLSLLTTSHPLLASTIEGATSAYGGAKNFSPRFRSGAEYVEGYLSPIANTVGSVGRVTGVEGGVRWFLGAGRRQNSSSSDLETGNGKKRRKGSDNGPISNKRFEAEGMTQHENSILQDPFSASKSSSRRMSMASTETLPAYDDIRSPAYTESSDTQVSTKPSSNGSAWHSRLIVSTSGLSVAMSEESLRSLKYCLRWLKWANEHIGRVITALKSALDQFDQADSSQPQQISEKAKLMGLPGDVSMEKGKGESKTELAARIASLKGDVLKTLQDVINTVSKYAGGALPENARILVRRHLTSLPQRFRVASMSERAQGTQHDSDSAIREGAHKVLVLAREGLDMVSQVSEVVDGTIESAEEWCDRMGKRRRKPEEEKAVLPQAENEKPALPANGDAMMMD